MAPNNQTTPDWRQKMANVIAEINKIKRPTQRRAMMKLFFPGQNGVTVPSETRLATTAPEMMTIGAMYDDAVAAIPEQEVVRQLGQLVAQKTQEITQDPVKRSALIKYFSPYTPLMTQQELDYIYEKSASDPDFAYMYQYYNAILSANAEEINKFNASNPTTSVTMPYPITNYKAIEPAINEEISRETSGLVPPAVVNGATFPTTPVVSAPAPSALPVSQPQANVPTYPVAPIPASGQQVTQQQPQPVSQIVQALKFSPAQSSAPFSKSNSQTANQPTQIPSVWEIPGVTSPIQPRQNTKESIAERSKVAAVNNNIASLFASAKPDELKNFVNATAFVSNGTVPQNSAEEQAMYQYIQSSSDLWRSWVEKNFGDKNYFLSDYQKSAEREKENRSARLVEATHPFYNVYDSLSDDKKKLYENKIFPIVSNIQKETPISKDQEVWLSSDDPIAGYLREKILESSVLAGTDVYKIAQKALSAPSSAENAASDQMYQGVTGIVQNDPTVILPETSPQYLASVELQRQRNALAGQSNAPSDQMYSGVTGIVQNDPNWVAPTPDPIALQQQLSRRIAIAARQQQNAPQYEMYSGYGGVLSQAADPVLDPVSQAIINLKNQMSLAKGQRNAPQEQMYSGVIYSNYAPPAKKPSYSPILSNEQLYQGFQLQGKEPVYENAYLYNVPKESTLNPYWGFFAPQSGATRQEAIPQDQMYKEIISPPSPSFQNAPQNEMYQNIISSGWFSPENAPQNEMYKNVIDQSDKYPPEYSSDWKNRSPVYAPESVNYGPPYDPGYVSQNRMYPEYSYSPEKTKENAPQDKMYKDVVDGYVEPPPQNPAYSSNLYLGSQTSVLTPPEQYGPSAMSGYPWQKEEVRNSTEPWGGYKNRRANRWGGY